MIDLVPAPSPTPLFPYQEFGAGWIASRERAGLLDRPRVGKSPQTIRALDLRRLRRGLVIGPAHLREDWVRNIHRFSVYERRVCKGRTIHDLVAWQRGVYDVMVLSFEQATRWAPHFHAAAEVLDFVAIDEFHYVNNLETARARAILGEDGDGRGGIVQWALQSWALTGTLMSNDPANCYAFLRFVGALDMPFATFVRIYFTSRAATWGQRNKPRPEKLADLQGMLRAHSISRTLEEVVPDLPPMFLTTTTVDGDTRAVRELLAAHPGLDDAIVSAVQKGGLSALRLGDGSEGESAFEGVQHIATLRRLIAEAKALPYAEMLLDELAAEPDRKIVVMGISRVALQMIHEFLTKRRIDAVLVQGGVSDAERVHRVDCFQNNPRCRVFVGNLKAAGTGSTLDAASFLDMFEWDWSPTPNDQGAHRIRSVNQKNTQYGRFISLANSCDETVAKAAAEKAENIGMISGARMFAAPPREKLE